MLAIYIINMFFISFQCFYKNLRGQSRTEANWSIREHVKRTCKKMMNEEKRRLVRKMKETGKSAKDLRPGYFQGPFWENLLKYWDSDTHKHRSKVGSQNREKVETLHTAGAKSFEAIEMVIQNIFIIQFRSNQVQLCFLII